MGRRTLRSRGLYASLTAAAVALPLALGSAPAAAAPAPPGPSPLQQKAETKVLGQLGDKDRSTFWIRLGSRADVSAARAAESKDAKARALFKAETEHAEKSQAGVRTLLKKAGAHYKSFWISNTIKVTADKSLAEKIAARPEVTALEADDPVVIPDPLPGKDEPSVDAVEWNVDRVDAPKVWTDLGVRGEGVVIANIDTGVQYDHPAVKAGYRGLKSDGSYSHDYNWFDPASVCSGTAPCDNNGHGTHTMGTMVGDDGAGNQVGVAPGAKWIAAKGCESSSCSRDSLLASGQWVVAPTDSAGLNPRPDLAPDVVNNSWGSGVYDTWYRDTVQSWRDAGIFPAFSNGNSGPNCNTSGSPGMYTNAYSSGAFDINNTIASFSSRGTGENGAIKPDLAAPGVNVRSAWTGGGYNSISGTSMASPHTAATVALMWSASPALQGDVAETEKLLDASATDVDNTTCGGTAADNNVFGEGRLNAFDAVSAAPRGALGAVAGTVTSGSQPLADATVKLSGTMNRTLTTGQDGTYALPKAMVGEYTLTVSKFGYLTKEYSVTVVENETATRDAALDAAPSAKLSGTVRTEAGPEAGAAVAVQGTPVSTETGADGTYEVTLPVGSYDVAVTPVSRCASGTSVAVEVTEGGATKNVDLASRTDTAGTSCRPADRQFPTGDTELEYSSNTYGAREFDLPFPVALYGDTYRKATATIEGVLAFGDSSTTSINRTLPSTLNPDGALYPFWDNLQLDDEAGVYWATRGTAPHRQVVVEWRNVIITSSPSSDRQRISFAAVLGEDGAYSFHYKDIGTGSYENGSGATIGAENAAGTDALQYAYNEPAVRDGMTIAFRTDRSAIVSGTVKDDNDGLPVDGAGVEVTRDGAAVGSTTTGEDGSYLVQVPAEDRGDYTVAVTADHYAAGSRTASLTGGEVSREATSLATGRVQMQSPDLEFVIPADETRTRTMTLANSGSATDYTVSEKDGAAWLKTSPASGNLAKDEEQKVTLTFDTAGAAPGSVLRGTVQVASDSGREPVLEIPVTVAVPAYRKALDTGATGSTVDLLGDSWGPDRAYAAGGYGYLGSSATVRTTKTVSGTEEQDLFRTARQGPYEYRFDGMPDGVYQVELGFAELSNKAPDKRVFDILAEGTEKVSNLDIALEAGGSHKALTRSFTVEVKDGQLNLRLVAVKGKSLVNTLRVSHRPDLNG
ncbi:S8 family serine peptidase [Streptomyces meridianus]|uniref:alpha-amylase n=1 Tax=Streptomyces meridianus TaxID=2938945 RepID=A0ABT0X2N7_9ACTN|nr:S8 family serine peptidase [Streptomyces meridianus]MCM2576806.1 S8 family serine peptidase [Streptomyces meridianus]